MQAISKTGPHVTAKDRSFIDVGSFRELTVRIDSHGRVAADDRPRMSPSSDPHCFLSHDLEKRSVLFIAEELRHP